MKSRWAAIRNTVIAFAFLGSLAVGARQAVSSDGPATPEGGSCNQWACKTECAPFGGSLGPGGPGEPLQCRCCG